MTLKELYAAQEKAGAAYKDALDRLYECYVQLASVEACLANANISGHLVPSFNLVQNAGPFAHPLYAPVTVGDDWAGEVCAARDRLIAEFSDKVATPIGKPGFYPARRTA